LLTLSTSVEEIPPIVTESVMPKPMPLRRVPVPSVATSDGTPMPITRNALKRPNATPNSSVAATAHQIDHWWFTFSHATSTAPNPIAAPIERSNSFAVRATIKPSVMISRTACVPKIVWKLTVVGNVDGRMIENSRITAAHTRRIP
jgi:hypothetical protein